MSHSNQILLTKMYSDFSKGELNAMLAVCDDKIKFEIPGKSLLAGKYTKVTFATEFAKKVQELSAGSFKIDIHELFASDRHGIVLSTNSFTRHNKLIEYRTVHVWRFENGKPVAFYEYPRDLYQFDAVWN